MLALELRVSATSSSIASRGVACSCSLLDGIISAGRIFKRDRISEKYLGYLKSVNYSLYLDDPTQ